MRQLCVCLAAAAALAACSGGERRDVLLPDGSPSVAVMDFSRPLALDRYPLLAWDWFVEQPIAGDFDETAKAGDDHPARLYLKFGSAKGETHAMEIIWGNRRLRAGDWKYLESFWSRSSFPHYVARGGDENAGRWHDEKVDLRALYRKHWGDPRGASLKEVALFCDTDATGAQSVAYFSTVRVERAP